MSLLLSGSLRWLDNTQRSKFSIAINKIILKNQMEDISDTKMYDICIVGAGIFGCAAARHASANPNLRVCLVGLAEPTVEEMKDREIFSSHYDSGRFINVVFELPSFQVLAQKSIRELRSIEKLSGLQFYSPVGALCVGKRSSRCMKELEDVSCTLGTKIIRMIDKDYFKDLYPFLRLKDDEYGILDTNGSGTLNPRTLIEAEKTIARSQGCDIIVDQVIQINKLEHNHHKVVTAKNLKLKAKRVLITTGAFTNFNNFEVAPQMEIYVYREKAAMVKIPESEAKKLSTMPGIVHRRDEFEDGFYMLPPIKYPDGYYLKIGSMWPENRKGLQSLQKIKDYLMSDADPEETKRIAQRLFEFIPDLKHEKISCKICVTAETPTGFPYVDRVSPTVTVAVAGCGWGATWGEEIGRLAARLSLTGDWDSSIPKTLFEVIPKEE